MPVGVVQTVAERIGGSEVGGAVDPEVAKNLRRSGHPFPRGTGGLSLSSVHGDGAPAPPKRAVAPVARLSQYRKS
jgi:hypothetical protein